MNIVDLSQPYGGKGKYGGSFQAVSDILDSIGKVERLRQERSLNSKVINAVSQGMGTPQNIARIIVENQPQYSPGGIGLLQQIAEKFAPPSMIKGQVGQVSMQTAFGDPYGIKKAQAKYYTQRAEGTTTLSPIMRMVREGLITQAEGRKLARKDADNDLGEKDIISIMHTIERALEATYDAIGSPLPGREDQRKYYVEQLEQYKSRLDEYRSATRRGETESYYSPSNPPLENLPLGTLEINRLPPKAPRPYLNSYWGSLDDDTKNLVTRAITKGATQIEILKALRARGSIK